MFKNIFNLLVSFAKYYILKNRKTKNFTLNNKIKWQ